MDKISIKAHGEIRSLERPIYLDYQATTPMDPRVLEEMLPYFTEKFGNPHSRTHPLGWEAEEAIEEARAQVANLINSDPKEIIFTSGATESNNLALKGVAKFYKNSGKNHIITSKIEHKCILDTSRYLEQDGFEITYLPVNSEGLVSLEEVKAAIKPNSSLLSVIALNNEIGTIQNLKALGEICRERGIFFHTDAAQAFGKIPLDVKEMKIDLMSISGHKIYAPKGVGALYVSRKPRVRLQALINGGGQERGLRSGTLPTPLIVGLGKAAEIAKNEMDKDFQKVKELGNYFFNKIMEIPAVYFNGSRAHGYPGCLNFSFSCIEGESMIGGLKGLAVSSGSACTSASLETSYVLKALGLDEELAHTSIRFGLGRFTTKEEIDQAILLVKKAVEHLRNMSPLWDMMLAGIDLKTIQWDEGH
jgi:cysteine desulfurase